MIVTKNLDIYDNVLDSNVRDILKSNDFVVLIAPEATFFEFKDFKQQGSINEVDVAKDDYFKMMEASADLQDLIEDIKRKENADEILLKFAEAKIEPYKLSTGEDVADLVQDYTAELEQEIKKAWDEGYVNMIVRLRDLQEFISKKNSAKDVPSVRITVENLNRMMTDYGKLNALKTIVN